VSSMWLCFVTGRPGVSAPPRNFWIGAAKVCSRTEDPLAFDLGYAWHKSQIVRTWIRQHNQQVASTAWRADSAFLLPTKALAEPD